MDKQNGYINFKGLFIGLLIIGVIVGIAIWELLKWLWPFVKAWIHAVTA